MFNVINMIKFKFALTFLLVVTLAVVDKYFSGYKIIDGDNEVGARARV